MLQWNALDEILAIYFIERHKRFECGYEILRFVTFINNKCEIVLESLLKVDSSVDSIYDSWKIWRRFVLGYLVSVIVVIFQKWRKKFHCEAATR